MSIFEKKMTYNKKNTTKNEGVYMSESGFSKDTKESPIKPLYQPLVDSTVFEEENIFIDEHSLKLLHAGGIGQRYAVVGFVDNGKLYLHFRPSFLEENKPADNGKEEMDKFYEKEPNAKNFDLRDMVFAPKNARGVVHGETYQLIHELNAELKEKDSDFKHMPGIFSDIQMGLSFVKKSADLNLLDWLPRSTKNFTIFRVDPLARVCFYFSELQSSFKRPHYTVAFHTDRTLEPNAFEKIMLAVRKKVLATEDSPALQIRHKELLQEIQKQVELPAFKEWPKIQNDQSLIAKRVMRTIYYASGMTGKPDQFQHENFNVIIEAIAAAIENNITLDLNYIPPETIEPYKDPALLNACRAGDLNSVNILLDYNYSNEVINYTNCFGETPIIIAILKGNLAIAKFLIEKGAVVSEELRTALSQEDIESAQQIAKQLASNQYNVQQSKQYAIDYLQKTNSLEDIKSFIEDFMPKHGLSAEDFYSESKKTFEDFLVDKFAPAFMSDCGICETTYITKIKSMFSKQIVEKLVNTQSDESFENNNNSGMMQAILTSNDFLEIGEGNRENTIDMLLKNGIDTTIRNKNGQTAVMLAIEQNDFASVQQILNYSSESINIASLSGQTALTLAALKDNLPMTQYLLSKGADLDLNTLQVLSDNNKYHTIAFILMNMPSNIEKTQQINEAKILTPQSRYVIATACIDYIDNSKIDTSKKIELLDAIINQNNLLGNLLQLFPMQTDLSSTLFPKINLQHLFLKKREELNLPPPLQSPLNKDY